MMKTLCVAVAVLSLASVCQSAPLTCEKLSKPLDKGPDVSGRWYLIAASLDSCLATTLVNALFSFSVQMDVTPKDVPNVYHALFNVKVYGLCGNESENLYYENNSIYDVNSNNVPYGKPDVLLQSGCPDCIVVKADDETISMLMLFSRRQTVSAAELTEFEEQAKCISWSKPLVLNSDHNYDNCTLPDDDTDDSAASQLQTQIYQRFKTHSRDVLACFVQDFLNISASAIDEVTKLLW